MMVGILGLTLTDLHLDICQLCLQKQTDCSFSSKSLSEKSDDQRLKPLGTELHLGAMSTAGGGKTCLESVCEPPVKRPIRHVAVAARIRTSSDRGGNG